MSASPCEDLPSLETLRSLGEGLLDLWQASWLSGTWSVAYNHRMRTRAGLARLPSRRIELNPRLLSRHPSEVDRALAHELAHIVVFSREGPRAAPHGPSWQALMKRAGFEPETRHSLDVSGLARGRSLYLHLCRSCGASWLLGSLRRDRVCESCGPGRVRVLRGPLSAGGRRALEEKARGQGRAFEDS